MISKKMENMVANSSAIRAMFEEGNRLAKIYGPENVFDFSLGNPNVPAPKAVKQAILDILDEEDEVIIPTPYWVSYPEQVKLAGGKPVYVEGLEENQIGRAHV